MPSSSRPAGPPVTVPDDQVAAVQAAAARPGGARAPRGRRRGARRRRRWRPLPALPPRRRRRAAATVVHVHGGGFVYNDIDVHDAAARRLANRAGLPCCRSATGAHPSTAFPAAVDDVDTVLAWLARDGAALGLDRAAARATATRRAPTSRSSRRCAHPGRFAALRADLPASSTPSWPRSRGARPPTASGPTRAAGTGSSTPAAGGDLTHPDLAPLRSDRLGTLPPTLVATAEHDPARDEGELLALPHRRGRRRRWSPPATSARSTASGGSPPRSPPPGRSRVRWPRSCASTRADTIRACACTSAATTPASTSRTTSSPGCATTATSRWTTARGSTTRSTTTPSSACVPRRRSRPSGQRAATASAS